jgi:ElaA protein
LYDAEAKGDTPRRSVGRMVVRADRRGEGLAKVLVGRVIEQHGAEPLVLHSQHYVTPLYASFGFEEVGDVYIEAGIPHITMYRPGRGRP